MVDNCYGEFVETIEPTDVGADMIVGSLIKNPGGGLAPIGGYIAGKKECVDRASYRLSAARTWKRSRRKPWLKPAVIPGIFLIPNGCCRCIKRSHFCSECI